MGRGELNRFCFERYADWDVLLDADPQIVRLFYAVARDVDFKVAACFNLPVLSLHDVFYRNFFFNAVKRERRFGYAG